jgi:hypothetical protein
MIISKRDEDAVSNRKIMINYKKILTAPMLLVLTLGLAVAPAAANIIFTTHLSGDEEVPPVTTQAQGQAIFKVSPDGTTIHYKIITSNIENVLMAHIHLASAGVNGPIVAWLYPSTPPAVLIPDRTDGVLMEGTITASDLVGPLAGHSLSDLINEMTAGNTYVNVHTSQNPGGEIRGQID